MISEWKTIDSAPKDEGCQILVAWKSLTTGKTVYSCVRWSEEDGEWRAGVSMPDADGERIITIVKMPTHWMELPAQPEAE